MDKRTTQKLEETLRNIDSESSLSQYMKAEGTLPGFDSFYEYFLSLPEVQNTSTAELIRKSGIERTYVYQILNGRKRNPSKDKILRLCLAAGCTLNETIRALEIAGAPGLYARNKRDMILVYAIQNGLSADDANLLLDQFEETALK
ncbi:MAG: helix-turn-helix transcriptional regulator [Erysipelotrichales bacterium]|nr:helix-turn-helix transcriptional regulator [Erysipelotrichales bacterium]MBQ4374482.1 helix-turn-helix transcriptional regulator [Erysipelotrichales bacterium]